MEHKCVASVRPIGARAGEAYPCDAKAKVSVVPFHAPLCLRHYNLMMKYGSLAMVS